MCRVVMEAEHAVRPETDEDLGHLRAEESGCFQKLRLSSWGCRHPQGLAAIRLLGTAGYRNGCWRPCPGESARTHKT